MRVIFFLVILAVVVIHNTGGGVVAQEVPPYETYWYADQEVDHFGFEMAEGTWKQRVLISTTYWDPSKPGAMFFYTGNEGDITMFYNNTGWLFTLAEKLNGLAVFAEHRYYGESLPFGVGSIGKPRYLTSEQALADYAQLIPHLKAMIVGAADLPVVALGGSYGGMLAGWFRMKYPNIVVGALASSAPILEFEGLNDPLEYNAIITGDYRHTGGESCSNAIREGYKALDRLGISASGRKTITDSLQLCEPLASAAQIPIVANFLTTGWSYMAMTDYPYPTSFLQPMPAWPVTVSCKSINTALQNGPSGSDATLLQALRLGVGVYYNGTGSLPCFNITEGVSAGLGQLQWGYQACSEMVFPISSNGVTDMFPPNEFNMTSYVSECAAVGVRARPNWVSLHYQSDLIKAASDNPSVYNVSSMSNIIFSNGKLDPWLSGGVRHSLNPTVIALVIENAAHHLDLRFPNPDDPSSVTQARQIELEHIQSWIQS